MLRDAVEDLPLIGIEIDVNLHILAALRLIILQSLLFHLDFAASWKLVY